MFSAGCSPSSTKRGSRSSVRIISALGDRSANGSSQTRPASSEAPAWLKPLVSWGAGPRASLNLIVAGKARAALRGRCHVSEEDIRAVALPILRHRIVLDYNARVEGHSTNDIVRALLEEVPRLDPLF